MSTENDGGSVETDSLLTSENEVMTALEEGIEYKVLNINFMYRSRCRYCR